MRKKLESLRENVILAARFVKSGKAPLVDLYIAVDDLERYEAEEITGKEARANRSAPDTAHMAAALAEIAQGSIRKQIVAHLASCPPLSKPGFTDEQLERRIGGKHQTVSSARNWLVNTGWLRDSGIRRETASRRLAIVWELTPAAQAQLVEDACNHMAV